MHSIKLSNIAVTLFTLLTTTAAIMIPRDAPPFYAVVYPQPGGGPRLWLTAQGTVTQDSSQKANCWVQGRTSQLFCVDGSNAVGIPNGATSAVVKPCTDAGGCLTTPVSLNQSDVTNGPVLVSWSGTTFSLDQATGITYVSQEGAAPPNTTPSKLIATFNDLPITPNPWG